jgi:hypothetical protein
VFPAILIYLMLGKWVLAMPRFLDPLRFVLISVAGWMSQRHLQAIDYLREENRVQNILTSRWKL